MNETIENSKHRWIERRYKEKEEEEEISDT